MVHDYLVSCTEKGIAHKTLCENCVVAFDVHSDEGPSSGACEYQGEDCEDE
ncbi:hypothetical protein IAE49_01695 [Kosakonia sp. S58]|jgi:hypothetical protein|uniref:hypothetical protein n=1 Tax=Kosakonia sp. S57 TaxID=2767456 RepID=UPI00190473E2|nr:hypothetical protein [Kosakonia sp. S57]MBK0077977.1 hypothetical protein [Kosakonia sp. S57]MBK0084955.1 hypothetical protein [Kosakonia sp. S58]